MRAPVRRIPSSRTADTHSSQVLIVTINRPLRFLVLLTACGISPNWMAFTPRPATGLPERFDAPNAGPGEPTGCTSPLRDARDGTELVMLRSSNEGGRLLGDYSVSPVGRYGIGEKEALRVDCRAWRPIGVLPR